MFDALNSFLLETAKSGSTAVLILDEAQDLKSSTLEQIRLLSNFETNKAKLLQIILVGQPELRALLSKPSLRQIRQRITVSACLEPLDRQEVGQYISHRIRVAGGSDMRVFDEPAVDEVYRYSGGVPRVINVLCDKVLCLAHARDTGKDMTSIVEEAKQQPEATGTI